MANDHVVEPDHPTIGRYTTCGMPMRFERAPAAVPGPSPRFGQHTAEVLAEIGFGETAVAGLIGDGVVIDGSGGGPAAHTGNG